MRDQLVAKFEMKTTMVVHSGEPDVVTEGKILNRIVRATASGWDFECDQRHVEVLIEELDLKNAKSLSAPGADDSHATKAGAEPPALSIEDASRYRALSARANYIAVDRAECQFAIKELCRDMSSPTEVSWSRLVHLARYLLGRPRAVLEFPWQEEVTQIDIFSDANWAGCHTSRKSTSGGTVL